MKTPKRYSEMSEEERIKTSDEYIILKDLLDSSTDNKKFRCPHCRKYVSNPLHVQACYLEFQKLRHEIKLLKLEKRQLEKELLNKNSQFLTNDENKNE